VPFTYSRVLEACDITSGVFNRFNWQASTLVHGLNLTELMKAVISNGSNSVLPQALIAHIAIELLGAVQWLHSLDPPIYHMDLHTGNIMLDISSKNMFGMPRIALVRLRDPRPLLQLA
jgi:serine/threonine protein kinase